MRNFYIFTNRGTGWMMSDTIWSTKKDVIDASMFVAREDGVEVLIGFDDDKGMLRIPDHISDVPEN